MESYREIDRNDKRLDQTRKIKVCRPCSCGCDARGGLKGVGYLLANTGNGEGATIWIKDEKVFKVIESLINRSK